MSILDSAELLLQAKNYSGSGAWLDESGNSHDAQLGSTSGADTNDPLFKEHTGTTYVFLPGVSGNYVSTPDAAALDILGDIDLRIRVAMDDWTPSATSYLVTKWSAGNRSYGLAINTSGNPLFLWSEDGSGSTTKTSSEQTGFTNGTTHWLRATMDVDNGSSDADIKFWTADGTLVNPAASDFTQLGTTQTNGSTTSIADKAASVELGTLNGGTSIGFVGDIVRGQIYSGIDGTLVYDAALADATEPYATFTEQSSNAATVTINYAGTGLQSAVIDRDWWLFTDDDYFEIADDNDLDFSGSQDMTVMAVFRTRTVASGTDVLVAKKDNLTTSLGYALTRATATAQGIIADGTLDDDDTVATVAINTLHTGAFVRNTTDDDIEAFLDGVGSGSATTDSTTTTLANAFPLRIGATSNTAASFLEGDIVAIAIWRSALTDAEMLQANTLLSAVGGGHPHNRNVTAGQLLLTG